jgi:predicted small lipoprotein YifL
MRKFALLLLLSSLLSACGMKGPLYLPPSEPAAKPPAPAPGAQSDEKKDQAGQAGQ